MKLRLLAIYDTLADSFWFVPALMALLAGAAALGSVALDHAVGSAWVQDIGWVWSGGADGARGVLSVVAGSVMTVVSIVFSITVTALAQTSSHFGPRVLRNFTSDRGNQFTLGTFIATFVYCLLVLRTVRSVEEYAFVPYLSVNIGIALALASLAVLIFFIHHVSQSIQAENLIAGVGQDFQHSLPLLFPERKEHEEINKTRNDLEEEVDCDWDSAEFARATRNGYVQRVDDEKLMRLAREHDLMLRLDKRPGDFVTQNSPLLRAFPPTRCDASTAKNLRECFSIGAHRTPHQDAGYSLQQLVEIACHALSPGINEPFTALACIDWLGASLRGVAERETPTAGRCDDNGKLRVLAHPLSFEELAAIAFDAIRLYGSENPDIVLRLLQVIEELALHLRRENDLDVLAHHTQLIRQDAERIANADDKKRVEAQLERALRALTKQRIKKEHHD
jgi:uncharacterized membrane protein